MVTHGGALASIGETTRGVVDRIMATWGKATDSDKEAGATWYSEGEKIVDQLSAQTGRSRETVAAVIAHLSPRTTWSRNVSGATSFLLTGEAPFCMRANVDRAITAMGSKDPLGTINGPKTQRFARNLLGDSESVTVDVWAARVALGRDNEHLLERKGIYGALEHCYRLAARRAGVHPTTMQATTWIVARNGRVN